MVAPPSTQGAAFHPSLLRPGEGGRPPVPRGTREGPSLPGLRCRAVVVPSSLRTHTHTHTPHSSPARDRLPSAGLPSTSGCRQPKRHALEGSAEGTRLEGDSREGTAGNRGVGLAFDKTGIALPANLSLTCAPRRADGGRAEVARQAKLYAKGVRSRIGSRTSARVPSPIELSPPVSAR